MNHRYPISTVRWRLKEIFDPLRSVTYQSERQIFDPTTIDHRTVTAVVNRFLERIGSSERCHVFCKRVTLSVQSFTHRHTHTQTHTHTDRIFPISRRFRVVGQTPLRSSFPIICEEITNFKIQTSKFKLQSSNLSGFHEISSGGQHVSTYDIPRGAIYDWSAGATCQNPIGSPRQKP